MKKSVSVAFCGIMAALATGILFLAGIFPSATVALPALAGCAAIPVVAELGKRWGAGMYLACCALAFFFAPDREAAVIYILLFGYYPIVLPVFGKIQSRALRWAAKLLMFNLAAVLEAFISVKLLGIPWEDIGFLGVATAPVLLAMANLMFVLYDRALGGVIAFYFQRLRSLVRRGLARR